MQSHPVLEIHLPDADATTRLGAAFSSVLTSGDCLCLDGPLGAGKSHLARSIIQALQAPHGTPEDVPSPTYTLVQTYRAGNLPILHADLYRLGDASELAELGLEDTMEIGLSLIEWPDRLGDTVPASALWVSLAHAGDGRDATLTGGWTQDRLDRVRDAFDA